MVSFLNKSVLALLSLILPFISSATAVPRQTAPLSSVVEKAIKDKEPEWQLASKQIIGGSVNADVKAFNPDMEEDNASFKWKLKDEQVNVVTSRYNELEKAKTGFIVRTLTQVERNGYAVTRDGAELMKLIVCEEHSNCVCFFKNPGWQGQSDSYHAVFRNDRDVIFVRASKSDTAQRFALHIAQALRSK